MDYNTSRPTIRMREYGRTVQQMIEQACLIEDPQQRQQAANDIIATMNKLSSEKGNTMEKQAKLWNHLAYISGYKLNVEYPFEIIRED